MQCDGPPKDVANAYLNLLFGVDRQFEASSSEVKAGAGEQAADSVVASHGGAAAALDSAQASDYSALANCVIRRHEGRFEDRTGYNKDEYRWGSGEVEITDFMVTLDGENHSVHLTTGQQVMVVVWVRFRVDVLAPIFGLTIKTPDGVTVYGSNSRDFPGGPIMQSVRAGEMVRVVFMMDLRIGAGDFLISLGVAQEAGDGDVEPLDRRYDSVLIHVSRSSRCYGLADFDMRVGIEGVV